MQADTTLPVPPPVWSLASTLWLDRDHVELYMVDQHSDAEALVLVEVRIDLPRTASEPGYREELIVLDVEGAPVSDADVERNRGVILREFYSARSLGMA